MATPAVVGLKSCAITVNLFSGARVPIPPRTEVLITLVNGNQERIHRDYHEKSSVTFENLPFFDNFADQYTVVAWAKGYAQAGYTPVRTTPLAPAVVDLMLAPEDASYNFHDAQWSRLEQSHPKVASLLRAPSASDIDPQDRYTQLLEGRPAVLACFFNLVTAMSQIHLPVGTPVDYLREVIWDAMQQDRFFAWADRKLVDQVVQAAAQKQFAPEAGTAVFHPGATRSYKQTQFGEANVQLTFHESQTRTIEGVECVVVEPDIDYYKDPLGHALLEVTRNSLTGSITDPRQVYALRWIAGRRAGIPGFEPPYVLE